MYTNVLVQFFLFFNVIIDDILYIMIKGRKLYSYTIYITLKNSTKIFDLHPERGLQTFQLINTLYMYIKIKI